MSHPYRGIAIVVGISEYKNIGNLEGAVNDAKEMTKNLNEHHFDVIELINPSVDQINSGVLELNSRLKMNNYKVVIVYYAGHGVADFDSHFILGPEYAYKDNHLSTNRLNIEKDIIDEICEVSNPGHKKRSLLVILDTCRKKTEISDKEFQISENQRKNKRSIGILVGYACGRGSGAADGHHGLYTQFILEEFFKFGVCVLEALNNVNNRVAAESSNSQKPQMLVNDVNCFDFCFNELPETLEEFKKEIKRLESELMETNKTIDDTVEEYIKIKTELEEQRYMRNGVRAEYNGKIAALEKNNILLKAENEKLKLENRKLEEEIKHAQINQGKVPLESSTVISDSNIIEILYESTGGALWTRNKERLSWQLNSCTSEFKEVNGRITYIELEENNLIGMIPQELGRLSYLTILNLSVNKLKGVIPVELGKLSELKVLFLHGNQLTGAIPVELGKLSELKVLWLFDNQLTGEIPKELGKLLKLEMLRLDGNQLTGKIPKEFGELKNLEHFGLYNNQLTGDLPIIPGCGIDFHPQRLEQNSGHFETNDQVGRISEQF